MSESAFERPPQSLADEVAIWQYRLRVADPLAIPAVVELATERLDQILGLKGKEVVFEGNGYAPLYDENKDFVQFDWHELTKPLQGISEGVEVLLPSTLQGVKWPLIVHKINFLSEILYPDEAEGTTEPRKLTCYLDITTSDCIAMELVNAVEAVFEPAVSVVDSEAANNLLAVTELAERYRQIVVRRQIARSTPGLGYPDMVQNLVSFCEQKLDLTYQQLEILSDDAYLLQDAPKGKARFKRTHALRREPRLVTFLGIEVFERLGGRTPEQPIPGLQHEGLCMVVDNIKDLEDDGLYQDNVIYIPLSRNDFEYERVSSAKL